MSRSFLQPPTIGVVYGATLLLWLLVAARAGWQLNLKEMKAPEGFQQQTIKINETDICRAGSRADESRAAAAGGVTSYFEMPNTVPQTTTLEALEDKFQRAAKSSHVNYTFFFGATNDNVALFDQLDIHRIPGIKLFPGHIGWIETRAGNFGILISYLS